MQLPQANPGGMCAYHTDIKCVATGCEEWIPYKPRNRRVDMVICNNMCPVGCTNLEWPYTVFFGCQYYTMHPLPVLDPDVAEEQICDVLAHEILHIVLDNVEPLASSALDRLEVTTWHTRNGLPLGVMRRLE